MFKLFSHSSMFPLHYVQLFVVSLHFLPSLWLCSPSSSWMRLPFLPGLSSRDRDDDVHFHICCTCNFQQSKDWMIWSNFFCLNCYDTQSCLYILHVSCIQIDEAFWKPAITALSLGCSHDSHFKTLVEPNRYKGIKLCSKANLDLTTAYWMHTYILLC